MEKWRVLLVATAVLWLSSACTVIRVSVRVDGSQVAAGDSTRAAVSANGAVVAFVSSGSLGTACDGSFVNQLYVHVLATGTIECVSVDGSGVPGDGDVINPRLSADGRFVVFESFAESTITGCGSFSAIFFKDRLTGSLECVSVAPDGSVITGGAEPAISPDGRFVAFVDVFFFDSNCDILLRDRQLGATTCAIVSLLANHPSVSADGRLVAFDSDQPTLGCGGQSRSVFVRDLQLGVTTCVSVSTGGTGGSGQEPKLSADGRLVVFESSDPALVPGCAASGRGGIFVHDRATGTTTCASVNDAGTPADRDAFDPAISADGRFVAFHSTSGTLDIGCPASGFRQVFVRDRVAGMTACISRSVQGDPANGDSRNPAVAPGARGLVVAFESGATNLVVGDTNGRTDVFATVLDAGLSPGAAGAPYDFDGDRRADLAVFRQSTGEWLVFGSATGFPGPVLFGAPGLGDIPVPADYDGDGKADLAVFRASTAEWFIFGSATGFPGPVLFGAPGLGDVPVPADYDGDGKADLAVFRASTGQWFVFGSAVGFPGPVLFGAPGAGDVPVPADYDGDGKADLAVYRTSTAEYLVFGVVTGFPGPALFGSPGLGDVPVVADFDGDGKSDLGVFRTSTGEWLVFGSATGFPGPVLFGAPGLGDVPVPADYDGDGKADLAVYRTFTAEYFVFGSATGFPGPVPFGAPGLGDIPLNRPAALR